MYTKNVVFVVIKLCLKSTWRAKMDNVKQTKLQLNISYWSKMINECQDSGMNVTNWCKENGVNKRKYYYWLRKIREKACESMSAMAKPDIVPITSVVKTSASNDIAANVRIGNISIEITNNASEELIRNIFGVLSSTC